MEEYTLTIRQVANILGMKVRTIREWIRKGKLEGKKHPKSGRWFFRKEDVEDFMNGN